MPLGICVYPDQSLKFWAKGVARMIRCRIAGRKTSIASAAANMMIKSQADSKYGTGRQTQVVANSAFCVCDLTKNSAAPYSLIHHQEVYCSADGQCRHHSLSDLNPWETTSRMIFPASPRFAGGGGVATPHVVFSMLLTNSTDFCPKIIPISR
jgi:hypothetical protein